MDLKSKITEVLEKENHTFSQLAEYLHMTEEGLATELNNKTLEVRNLEAISKALRVPLYSFFREEGFKMDYPTRPYYINKFWTGDDDRKTIAELRNEIELLKQIISSKEAQLKRLES
jgi:transcriptional regulator with XRE-family HTH domain